jgi:ribosome-binding ATPase YchF (GTP1/OBG family)
MCHKRPPVNFLGSHAKAREADILRIEGKEYVVQDGDVIDFRFNV